LAETGINGRKILRRILEKIWSACVDCIEMVQAKVQWMDSVHSVVNLRFP